MENYKNNTENPKKNINKNKLNNIFVFSDFDGTITKQDTTDLIFSQLGDFSTNIQKLKTKEISIFEYWKRFCSILPKENFDTFLQNFASKQEIDDYFQNFVNLCNKHKIPLALVSDNFDVFIEQILYKYELQNIKYYSNKIQKNSANFEPIFSYASEGCEESFSAVCKRNVILSQTPDSAILVFIGDGRSDFGAAEISDIIFAKGDLAKYCSANTLPHFPFKTFFDIWKIFEKLINENKIRSRYQAQLKRKKHFEVE